MNSKQEHEYSRKYFEYMNSGSASSAKVICPLVNAWLAPISLLDVGCGAGAWCRVWIENGVADVHGVDGSYVTPAHLLFPQKSFVAQDLGQPFDLGRKFDLVTSLEVAEHIPASSADIFVDNLARHGDVLLFSAAVPGQGGEYHVHEQPLQYWRDKLAERGYRCFDPLRGRIRSAADVEPWYRYNALLYGRGNSLSRFPQAVLNTEIPAGARIIEVAPLSWRARNSVIKRLPSPVRDGLVRAKHAWVRWRNMSQERGIKDYNSRC